jgi:hypothetical protein
MPDELEIKLTQLRGAAERIGQNLVELELDSGRQLLAASTLAGASATRWSAASAALTELWQWNGLLEDLIRRAEKLRGGRRSDQLRDQLEGQSIELSASEVPLANRNLLESSEVTQRCTPDELLARMSDAFDEVKTVVAEIGSRWEQLTPRLDAAGRLLAGCTRLVEELGEPGPGELASAGLQLSALRKALSQDPLSVAAADIERLAQSLEKLRKDLEGSAALKRELAARIAGAQQLASTVRDSVEQAQAAHEELLIKISVPAAPEAPRVPERLEDELLEIQALADRGRWRDAGRRMDALIAQAQRVLTEAQRALAANRAPIEARNQFRALLDAYQVKAKQLGMVEDSELAEIYNRARYALYNAPTDLSLVGRLVRSYQDVLSGSSSKREARQ